MCMTHGCIFRKIWLLCFTKGVSQRTCKVCYEFRVACLDWQACQDTLELRQKQKEVAKTSWKHIEIPIQWLQPPDLSSTYGYINEFELIKKIIVLYFSYPPLRKRRQLPSSWQTEVVIITTDTIQNKRMCCKKLQWSKSDSSKCQA